ncbi:hypothetical protein ACE6H2_006677 [Prunus campanulata]
MRLCEVGFGEVGWGSAGSGSVGSGSDVEDYRSEQGMADDETSLLHVEVSPWNRGMKRLPDVSMRLLLNMSKGVTLQPVNVKRSCFQCI